MGRRPQPDCLSLGPGTPRAGPAGKLLCHSLQLGLGSQHSERRKESSDSDTAGVEIRKATTASLQDSGSLVTWWSDAAGGGRAEVEEEPGEQRNTLRPNREISFPALDPKLQCLRC